MDGAIKDILNGPHKYENGKYVKVEPAAKEAEPEKVEPAAKEAEPEKEEEEEQE